MTGFKIVFRSRGQLLSQHCLGMGVVEYGSGATSVPHPGCGPLCVYGDREAALEAIRIVRQSSSGYELWGCEYTPSTKKGIWIRIPGDEEDPEDDITGLPLKDLPDHTVLADSVTLTRRVL